MSAEPGAPMTARTCPTCGGRGEVGTYDRLRQPVRDENGVGVTRVCPECEGSGVAA